MPGEQIGKAGRGTSQGLHLFPCAVVAGVEAPDYDDRLQGAQSALNRVQVWVGDLLIALRRRRSALVQDSDPARERAAPVA
jgi:hypothetical protein